MNKPLKILFAIEFILILAIVGLALIDSKKMPTAYVVKEAPGMEKTEFKVLTKAVCEEKSKHVFCSDKLFIKCNDEENIISRDNLVMECDNIKLNLSDIEVNGNAIFKKEWVDPRKELK